MAQIPWKWVKFIEITEATRESSKMCCLYSHYLSCIGYSPLFSLCVVEWIVSPPPYIRYLWMLPYLEIILHRYYQVKIKSYWIRIQPKSIVTAVFIKEDDTFTREKAMWIHTGDEFCSDQAKNVRVVGSH